MSLCTDAIVVYDDASTEDVRPVYQDFDCDVVYGQRNEFHRELYHKQQLLYAAILRKPDWLLWFDSDAILGRRFETREGTEEVLKSTEEQGIVLLHLHNLNLWRSNGHYRTDTQYNDLWHGVWWKNTGQLHYKPVGRLHQKQYPHFWVDDDTQVVNSKFPDDAGKLIHFGFATDEEIARKYFTYRAKGQAGFPLDRLAWEGPEEREIEGGVLQPRTLEQAPGTWFPEWYLKEHEIQQREPEPLFDPAEMMQYVDFDEWQRARQPG